MQKFTALIAAGALLASVGGAFAAGTSPAQPAKTPAAAPTATTTPGPATATASATTTAKPMASHHHMAMHMSHVKAIQTALNSNGEQLAVDGRWGPKSRAALKDFQQKNGLKPTGHADKATMEKLKVSM